MNRFITKTIKYLVATLLLSALIIYVFIEIKPAFFLGAPVDYYYCTYQYEQINKKTGFSNIIIGDSRGNASVNPKVLGNKWINLSIPGSDLFEGCLTLKKYLLNNKVDTLVMVYGLYYLAEISPYFNRRTVPFQFVSYNELKDLEQVEKKYKYKFHDESVTSQRALSLAQYDRRLKYWHFPFHYRETFIDGLNSLCNTWADVNVAKQKVIKQLTDYRGYMNFGEADSNNTDGINGDFEFYLPSISKHYFDQLMDVAAKNKIAVYLMVAPINQASFMSYNKSPFQTTVDKYMKTLQTQYANLHLVPGPVCLPNTMFGDPYHVNKKGTAFFSEITRKMLDSTSIKR
ncbi:hypothetical protein A3860_22380 [Niastella vici]|uniref:DUF1574 domain-containing protein n=1 Tax=Niastella vici TaxID=1703345 RepID=A0A1V9G0K9_9BACT|nr:hypothetical protein [Niastella vici]OQP64155.1 hypothetical protein A3860_22380 [Niastella vici]